jgi:methylglutaconyl-CoA hydratase
VNHVTEAGETALDRALALAREMQTSGKCLDSNRAPCPLSRSAPLALVAAKEAIMRGMEENSLERALQHERRCYESLLGTRDRLEALDAFRQRRSAVFVGE